MADVFLHNLKPNPGSTHSPKRKGRGEGSGRAAPRVPTRRREGIGAHYPVGRHGAAKGDNTMTRTQPHALNWPEARESSSSLTQSNQPIPSCREVLP